MQNVAFFILKIFVICQLHQADVQKNYQAAKLYCKWQEAGCGLETLLGLVLPVDEANLNSNQQHQ